MSGINKLDRNNIENVISLTSMQQGMLFHYISDEHSSEYHEQLSITITGDMKKDLLQRAWDFVIETNEMLRTVFRWKGIDNPIQIVLKKHQVLIQYFDFTNELNKDEAVENIKLEDLNNRIDITKETLRIYLCKLDDYNYQMIISNHHIIYDGWSNGIILKELMQAYNNLYKGEDLKKINKTKFSEFIKFTKALNRDEQKTYWSNYLRDFSLDSDYFKSKELDYSSKEILLKLDKRKSNKVKEFAKQNKISLSNMLYGIWGIVLQKLSNSDEVIFGTTVSGRNENVKDIDNMVGLFVNTVPLKVKSNNDSTFINILQDIDKTITSRKDFDNTPLIDIRKYCGLKTNENIYNSLVTIENYPLDLNKNNVLNIIEYSIFERANYNMSLEVFTFDDLEFKFTFNKKVMDESMGYRFTKYLEKIIDLVLINKDISIKEIELPLKEEKEQILYEFNNIYSEYKNDKTIQALFEKQVEKTPDNIALIYEDFEMTYRELNQKSNALARSLRARGVRPGDIVGIMIERSIDMIVGVIGILKSGSAYLPIDIEYPNDRITYMFESSGASVLITKKEYENKIEFSGDIINIKDNEVYDTNKGNLDNLTNPEDLSYLIYTSGTTGKAKGIMTSHNNVLAYLESFTKLFNLSQSDVTLQQSSFTFDGFVEEVYSMLLVGGKIILPKNEEVKDFVKLKELIDKHGVTILSCSPLILDQFNKLEPMLTVKNFLSSSDILKKKHYSNIINYSKVHNMYGPTETTVCATYYECKKEEHNEVIPIGKAIQNYRVYILDKDMKLLPKGVVGELYISGYGISHGYLNNKELTAEKFIENPFESGKRMYKTGDLGRWLPDGNIEFIGRIDTQVKIRGFRIEIGEIEKELFKHKYIKEALVIDREDEKGNKYLCAYIVSKKSLSVEELREHLGRKLPEYMIPNYFIQIDRIPLTLNGKIDKGALPKQDGNINIGTKFEAPRNEMEERIANIWKTILEVDKVGINDNFFSLGGHSLKAITLVNKIHKELNIEISLKEVFKTATIKGISEYIEKNKKSTYLSIKPVEEKEYYEASSAQKRMYLLQQLDLESIAYNMTTVVEIEGLLNVKRLEKAIKKLIKRHEILRTSFETIDGVIIQKINNDVNFEMNYTEVFCNEKFIEEFVEHFDLSKAPLLRAKLIKVEDDKYIFMFDIHHIIGDGSSSEVLIKELVSLYEGKALDELKIQYKDYTHWQNNILESKEMKKQEKYWIDIFNDEIPILNLPYDYERPAIKSFEGDTVSFVAEEKITEELRKLSKETGTTMHMILLSAFNILLSKYSGQKDIIIGTPISGRPHADLENLIGMFVNTLALRNKPEGDKKYIDFLKEVKENSINAYDNQSYQFDDLIEKLDIKRNTSRNPLFDVVFTMEDTVTDYELNLDDIELKRYDDGNKISKFDLTLNAVEKDKTLKFNIEYCSKLFNKETIERLSNHYIKLLEIITSNTKIKICEIELITEKERNQILFDFNDTNTDYPRNKTIHEMFEEQVEITPDNIAVVFEDKKLTYRELNEKSNQVARILRNKGIRADSIVGIMVEKSPEMIIGIIGSIKAGGAYLPIDPIYPKGRKEYMLKDSKCSILLTTEKLPDDLEFGGEVIDLSKDYLLNEDSSNLEIINKSSDLAYVIYTSGTTGKPKGAMIEHRSLNNLCNYHNKKFNITENDRATNYASFSFDACVWEIWPYLISGASVYIINDELKLNLEELNKFYETNSITVSFLPTQICEKFIEIKNSSLRFLLTGGDKLKYYKSNSYKLVNNYGPTEATVVTTSYLLENVNNIYIGKPINNLKVYILDSEKNLLPVGIAGELCIAGDGLSRGYLNKQELTAKKFVDNPFEKGDKMYKTGDLARWLPDGNIEFLGRIDHQVKIRGFRIELGEIERNLLKIEDIKEVVVLDKGEDGNKYLCAYYVSEKDYSISDIRQKLKKSLPEYMIPSYFMKLENMPVTTNGKLDRKSLPEPEGHIYTGAEYEAPRNELEENLVEIWQKVLGVSGIGINDDFFSLGGDSIKSIQVLAKAKEKGYYFEIKDLFKNSNIKALSKHIEHKTLNISQETVVGEVELTPIQKWFFKMEYEEEYHWNQSVMLFSRNGFEDKILEKAFEAIIKHHDALRMIYKNENGNVIQFNRGTDGKLYDLSVYDYRDEETVDRNKLREICNEIQGSISLEDGPLVKLGLFKTNEGDHLLIAIHHLVIDGVSWRILFENLSKAYEMAKKGEKVILQEKTTSFKEWAKEQKKYGSSYNVKKQLEYWDNIEKEDVKKLPKDKKAHSDVLRDSRGLGFKLTKQETEKLLNHTNRAYNTEINDILLTALSLTISQWAGTENVLINLESHGREEIIKNMDISRTIGWFTTQYPVILKNNNENLGMMIKNTKDSLRRIPNKGIGYGIIKYLSDDEISDKIQFGLEPEISFNYLGQFDEDINNDNFEISSLDHGNTVSLNNKSLYPLDFSAVLIDKSFNFNIAYNCEEYNEDTIQLLVDSYKNNLIKIIEHCMNKEVKEKTASDITKENISLDELKLYVKDLDNIKNIYPLTPMQDGMLYHTLADNESQAYHESISLKIKGQLDVDILEQSFNKLIDRHEALRTSFDYESFNKNMQIVFNERRTKIRYEDISKDDIDREAYIDEIIRSDKKRSFNLNKDILIRLAVVRTEEDIYNLILSNHHIILDGWCLSIMIVELFKIYNELKYGYKADMQEVVPYSKYIEWLNDKDKDVAKEYWREYLSDYTEVCRVPFKKNKVEKEYKKSNVSFTIDKQSTEKFEKLARDNKVTINTIMQSIWAILLQKYNNSDDSVFGYVTSGRNPEVKGIENMLGLFINTVPLRVRTEKEMTFKDLLVKVNNSFVENSEHDYYPLADIQALSEVKSGLINNIMVFENYPVDSEGINNEVLIKNDLEIMDLCGQEQTNYNFNLIVVYKDNISIKFDFNESLYSKKDVLRIKNHFENIINEVINNERALIKDIELVDDEERKKLLKEFNDTKTDYPRNKTIHQLFEEQVEKTPDNIAAVFEDKKITYSELNSKSNTLARKLISMGAKKESIIGVMVEPSIEMAVAILGILKSGAAYLPISAEYPQVRIERMLSQCNVGILLTQQSEIDNINYICNIIDVRDEEIYSKSTKNLGKTSASNNLAYVIYTSGTTGNPKGVMIEHRSAVAALEWRKREYNFSTNDNILQLFSNAFDGFVTSFFTPIISGAKVILVGSDEVKDITKIKNIMIDHKITSFIAIPSLGFLIMNSLSNSDDINLRRITFAGEALTNKVVEKCKNLKESIEITNEYGPTENSVVSTFNRNVSEKSPITIGKPRDNTKVYIVDRYNNLLPIGAAGELCLSGNGLSRGYLNRPELTAQKFVDNPFEKGNRMYKTGDLARWLPDGNIEFLGRIDHQVKIRGFRIELGEIERNLLKIEGIKEAVVLDKGEDGNKYLCAYYVSEKDYSISEIREKIKKLLPNYMIPSYFMKLKNIPITTNGKVDRKSLPEPEGSIDTGVKYEAPRNEVEENLVEIWQKVLGVSGISINDDFFSLGGDSIKSIQVLAKAKEKGYYFEIKDLFDNSNIKALSKQIEHKVINISQEAVVGEVELTPIQKWFFEMEYEEEHHWNQSIVLFNKSGFEQKILEKVFGEIIKHHDALRMVYKNENGNIIQFNRGTDGKLYDLSVYDYREAETVDRNKLREICNEIQGSISLEDGPLVKLGLFKTNEGDHLLIAIHHLVIDGVSWRILFENLSKAYEMAKKGENIILQEKTTSFKEWAKEQKKYVSSYNIKKQLEYWKNIENEDVKKLPKDRNAHNAVLRDLRSLGFKLTKQETEKLLNHTNRAYNTEINDILLTALSLTISKWSGTENVLINLESHGREEIIKNIDITRTIGWFTTQYPVILKNNNENLGTMIKNTKDLLRRIPNKGIGYGIIKYLSDDEISDGIQFGLEPEISFNYLGQFDEDINNDIFEISSINAGNAVSLKNKSLYSLNFSAVLIDESFSFNIGYNSEEYNEYTIQSLVDSYKNNLIQIVDHCVTKEEKEKTASDITKENISLDELKLYLKDLDNIKNIYPLTPMQEGMLYYTLFNDESESYHEHMLIKIKGQLDVDILEQSFNKLIERHEALRTSFDYESFNKNMQIVFNERRTKIRYEDISKEEFDRETYIDEIIRLDKKRSFNLNKDILIRLAVVRTEEDIYNLILSNHHIILDGWCLSIMIVELFKIYNELKYGYKAHMQEVVPYSKYIEWLNNKDKDVSKEYWRDYLSDYTQVCRVPFKKNKIETEYKNSDIYCEINRCITNKLEKLAKDNKVTINTIMQSIWAILLQKYNNSNDSVFGYVTSGRNPEVKGIENMLGLFINTVPLRVRTEKEMTFKDLLVKVNNSFVENSEHDYYPLADIQALSKVKGELISNIMVFENYPVDSEGINNEVLAKNDLEIINFCGQEQTNYNFNLIVVYTDNISIKFNFNESLYSKKDVLRIKNHFENIINQVINNERALIKDIELVDDEEKKKLLKEFNDTKTEYPRNKTIHQLFEEQAEKTPNNIAVVFKDEKLTYREINEKSNQLAKTLRNRGVKPDSIVGIFAEKSAEMIIGIMGILKAGGAYLPIDSNYPKERIEYMLKDSETSILLTTEKLSYNIEFHGEIINLSNEDSFKGDSSNLNKINNSSDLAYVIYTSGTTGKPKGVLCEHKNVIRLVKNTNYIEFEKKDKILQTGSMVFDASTFEVWGALLNGIELYLDKNETIIVTELLEKYIIKNNITILWLTSELFNQIAEENIEIFKNLRCLLVGGDVLSPKYISLIRRECKKLKIINGYGPTENTTFSTTYLIEKEWNSSIPIGKPIANSKAYIIDQNHELTPIGVAGELCVSGDGLARGYLNRQKLTAEKFIDNPFEQGMKMYKTGDLARWMPDGNIEFIGRIDHQVKIRGFRIELGEIVRNILKIEGIKEAVVLDKDKDSSKYLCAYYVAEREYGVDEFREELRKILPEYMIPAYFMKLENMPLTMNGKVDRKSLPEPECNINTGVEYEAPRNKVEEKLVEIWREILGVTNIGINDNFFELGGHSLKATTLVNRINKELNVGVQLKDIFSIGNIKGLYEYIASINKKEYKSLEKVKEEEYYEASSAQKRMFTLQELDLNSTAYNMPGTLEVLGDFEVEKMKQALLKLIKRHETLRTSFHTEEGKIVQKIHRIEEIVFEIEKIEVNSEKEAKEKIKEFIRPFNLQKAPLLRVIVMKLEKDRHIMMYDIHHIISDGVSMSILTNEFSKLYMGEELKELKIQYKDYSAWQLKKRSNGILQMQEEYWLREFSGNIPILNLPTDYERPKIKNFKGDSIDFVLDKEITERIETIAKEMGCTLYMVLLANIKILLSKYSGQEDIIVGSPIAGRNHKDLENIIGMFVNTLAIRTTVDNQLTFKEYLKEVKDKTLKIYENQEYQFEELVDKVGIKRDLSRNPLFDFVFVLQNIEEANLEMERLTIKPYDSKNNMEKFDITMTAVQEKENIQFNLSYATSLYKQESIERMIEFFKYIIKMTTSDSNINIKNIKLLTDEEVFDFLENTNQNKLNEFEFDF